MAVRARDCILIQPLCLRLWTGIDIKMGKCLFSVRWLTLPQYSRWLARESSGIHKAYSCLCSKSFDISAIAWDSDNNK